MNANVSEERSNALANKYGFIYVTTNKVNGKKYIGQRKYYGDHASYLGSGSVLRKAIQKYGIENFSREVIEECATKEELNERETFWIGFYNADQSDDYYNICTGGEGGFGRGKNPPWYGKHLSESHKEHLSSAKRGDKNPFFGKRHSDDARMKMSERSKGRKHTDEYKKMISAYMKANHPDVSGVKNPRARAVVQLDKTQCYIASFPYIKAASIATGISKGSIQACCSGRHKTAGGYVWKYENEYKEDTTHGKE